MGEIADSLLDGEFDYISGEYIGPGVGYPRTYQGKGNSSKRKMVDEKPGDANKRAVAGLVNYLKNEGMRNVQSRSKEAAMYIVRKFAETVQIPTGDHTIMCVEVQKDFAKFKKWYKESEFAKQKHSYPTKD